jgi:type IV pilus assembly protein PilC
MILLYKAAKQDGKIVKGLLEAKNISEAATYLRTHQLVPITIVEHKDNPLIQLLAFGSRINSTDLVFFTRQVASMLTSGLTLMQSLNVLKNQLKKRQLSEMISKIITDVEGGSTFSQALEKYPRVFSPIYISLVKSGETSGLLDKVMTRLADNLEKEDKLKAQIKGALLYPAIVVVMMIVVVFIMMLFVIPQLRTLYDSLAVELPISTKVLVGLSELTVRLWPLIFISIIGTVVLFRRWYRTKVGRKNVDTSILALPIVGRIIRLRILTDFTRTFGILVGSGAPVVGSISQAKGVSGNFLYEEAIERIANQVEKGVTLGDAFSASPLFPPILIQMIHVGEETGKLDENLSQASEYFEREVEQTVKVLTTAIEPFIMAVLGIGVAFLLVAVITPIYKLSNSF